MFVCLGASCPMRPLQPGRTRAQITATNQSSEVATPENPLTPAAQSQEWTEEESFIVPAGSVARQAPQPSAATTTNSATPVHAAAEFIVSEPMPVKRVITRKTEANTGAAQKDTARELTARFKDMAPVKVFGFVLILIGLASFTPWVRPFIGSTTFSIGSIGLGIGLIFISHAIVGHEVLVMAGATVGLLVYLFAHKHGTLQGMVNALKADAAAILPSKPL